MNRSGVRSAWSLGRDAVREAAGVRTSVVPSTPPRGDRFKTCQNNNHTTPASKRSRASPPTIPAPVPDHSTKPESSTGGPGVPPACSTAPTTPPGPARALLARLAACRHFESTIDDRHAGQTWRLLGTIEPNTHEAVASAADPGVDAATAAPGPVLVLREVARHDPARPGLGQTHRLTRWSAPAPDRLLLDHFRPHPTRLADFRQVPAPAAAAPGVTALWLSPPHLCGPDDYAPELEVTADAITLHWTITGPAKHARVVQRYFMPTSSRDG